MPDGSLYGVTWAGGILQEYGTIYRYDPAAAKMVFVKQFHWDDGVGPQAELLLASDGKLYGTTPVGGPVSCSGSRPFGIAM
jgi:uncharacterized repeat protein (TIGR03803 family)